MEFLLFISFILALRIIELIVAAKNGRWMLQNGAVEYGKSHYPWMVLMHTLFFVSIIMEYVLKSPKDYIPEFVLLYVLLIVLKAWIINSLGKFWNTKILRIPNISLVSKGPYKIVRHPNYIIVVLEIIVIPMTFHLYISAIVFTVLNAAMLHVRIRCENKALRL